MIKLFRKIHQTLVMENNTSKYLTYAVGEIVLVVIGILIALSINTWNENRKLRQSEQDILNNLKTELITNKAKLDNVYQQHLTEASDGIRMLRLFNTDIS
jgi:sensor domain CHASE-containing protein